MTCGGPDRRVAENLDDTLGETYRTHGSHPHGRDQTPSVDADCEPFALAHSAPHACWTAVSELPSHTAQLRYRADIDGLRAFAVLAVVFYHAFPKVFRGGFGGVDVFFVISGYFITQDIVPHLDGARFRFTEFYARPVRRIFPALILVLFATLAVGVWIF